MDLDTALTDKADHGNATDLLRADHVEMSRLFDDYQEAMDQSSPARGNLAQAICMQVELHSRVEAEVFYPIVGSEAPELVAEYAQDHQEIAQVIEILRGVPLDAADCDTHMLDLMDLVEAHVAAEEMELFPLLEERIDSTLLGLGSEILRYKERLLGSSEEVAARA